MKKAEDRGDKSKGDWGWGTKNWEDDPPQGVNLNHLELLIKKGFTYIAIPSPL